MNLNTTGLSGLIRPAVWGIGAAVWLALCASYPSDPGAVLLGTLFGAACSVKFFIELHRSRKHCKQEL